MIKIIEGYVGIETNYINNNISENKNRLDMIIISRRSSKNVGTRFNARGINSEGDVANFVETE